MHPPRFSTVAGDDKAIFGKRPLLVTVFGCVVDRESISLSMMIVASKLSISTKPLILADVLGSKCGSCYFPILMRLPNFIQRKVN
jgi:hypothetical protein